MQFVKRNPKIIVSAAIGVALSLLPYLAFG